MVGSANWGSLVRPARYSSDWQFSSRALIRWPPNQQLYRPASRRQMGCIERHYDAQPCAKFRKWSKCHCDDYSRTLPSSSHFDVKFPTIKLGWPHAVTAFDTHG